MQQLHPHLNTKGLIFIVLKTPRHFLTRAKECQQEQHRPLHPCSHQAASFHMAGEKGTFLVTRHPQWQMLHFREAADERSGWKLLGAQPWGGAHTPKWWEQPVVPALLWAPPRAQRGSWAGMRVCPCRRRWQGLSLCSGFAKRCNLSFLLSFLSKTVSDLDSNCTTFLHFGVIWRKNCASANGLFSLQDMQKNVFDAIFECCTHTSREEGVDRQLHSPSHSCAWSRQAQGCWSLCPPTLFLPWTSTVISLSLCKLLAFTTPVSLTKLPQLKYSLCKKITHSFGFALNLPPHIISNYDL